MSVFLYCLIYSNECVSLPWERNCNSLFALVGKVETLYTYQLSYTTKPIREKIIYMVFFVVFYIYSSTHMLFFQYRKWILFSLFLVFKSIVPSMSVIMSYIFFAAIGNIWDISLWIGYHSRYLPYLPFTCLLPTETWTWSKISLQCFEGIFCFRSECWICSGSGSSIFYIIYILTIIFNGECYVCNIFEHVGYGIFSWTVASLYEWRRCVLAVGCIT